VSDAYATSRSAAVAGPVLHRCVPRALQVGKRVRSETDISRGVTSVAGAAVSLAQRVFRDLSGASVVAVGAGRTVRSALTALRAQWQGALVVLNRTEARATELAAEFDGASGPLDHLQSALARADVVIAATGAAQPLLTVALLAPLVRARRGRPLLVLDLGVPRNVEPGVGRLEEVYLYDVDLLEGVAEQGRREREREVPRAEEIVRAALVQFRERRERLDADPSIRAVLDTLLTLRRDVVDGERGLTDAERAAADRVTGKLVDRLLRRIAPRLARRDDAAAALLASLGIVDAPDPDDPPTR
jgi:glutamyl-tRNA reductase